MSFEMFELFERAPVPEPVEGKCLPFDFAQGPIAFCNFHILTRLSIVHFFPVFPVFPFFLLQSFRFANDPEADAFDVGVPPDTLGLLGIGL